jgi:hypothetical protein
MTWTKICTSVGPFEHGNEKYAFVDIKGFLQQRYKYNLLEEKSTTT